MTPSRSSPAKPLVILNFHGVGPLLRELESGELDCWLSADHFGQILDSTKGRAEVQITFDDGNESDVRVALPALLHRGLKATFFVCSERMDRPTFLGKGQLKELQKSGMRIGSHGLAHRSWRRLNSTELQAEVSESRQALQDLCQTDVSEAACPFGEYDRRVLSALHTAGYTRVFTSDGGWTSSASWLSARNTMRQTSHVDEVAQLISTKPSLISWTSSSLRQAIKRLR